MYTYFRVSYIELVFLDYIAQSGTFNISAMPTIKIIDESIAYSKENNIRLYFDKGGHSF